MSDKHIVFLLALAACGRAAQPAPRAQAPAVGVADTVAEGTVRIVGPRETAQLVLARAVGDLGLTGPLVAELRRLSGARLRVSGVWRSNPAALPPGAVEVGDYQILAIDGQPAFVGFILSRDERLWLAGQDTLELVGAPADLGKRVGAKVYVVGAREGSRLQLKSYGVIREPGR